MTGAERRTLAFWSCYFSSSPANSPLVSLGMQSAIFHIEQALSLIGYSKTTVARRFANGELMRLFGEAERAGNQTPTRIVEYIMASKRMHATDAKLKARILSSVKDCVKRMNARGV